MNWVDGCLLAVLAASIVIGIIRGFTREALGLATWVFAIGASLFLAHPVARWLEPTIAVLSIRMAVSYGLVFFAGLVIGAVVTSIISSMVRKSPLSGVDRTVGGGFGVIRGVLLGIVFVWLVGMTPAREDPWYRGSFLIVRLESLAQGFNKLLPDEWQYHLQASAARAGTGST
jgi:membrane protein required for colicin V production